MSYTVRNFSYFSLPQYTPCWSVFVSQYTPCLHLFLPHNMSFCFFHSKQLAQFSLSPAHLFTCFFSPYRGYLPLFLSEYIVSLLLPSPHFATIFKQFAHVYLCPIINTLLTFVCRCERDNWTQTRLPTSFCFEQSWCPPSCRLVFLAWTPGRTWGKKTQWYFVGKTKYHWSRIMTARTCLLSTVRLYRPPSLLVHNCQWCSIGWTGL